MSDLDKIYQSARGPVQALSDINLELRAGEFCSIVGPSGCGKSTLMRCVAGLENITSGTLLVNGRPLDGPPDSLGVVFQRDVLLDWRTIIDNVLLPAEFIGSDNTATRARAIALLERFGLGAFQHRYPWELSGGMRQRASICRALLTDPDLLLMDEPFGALDAMTRDDLTLELSRIWQDHKKTVLFITHSISEAVFLSDRVIIMSRGPGRIEEVLDIDIPRPRDLEIRESLEFGQYVHRIRDRFAMLGIVQK